MASSKKVTTKKRSVKKTPKRTEAHFKVKVSGRELRHPVRSFWIVTGLILLPLMVGLASTSIVGNAMITFDRLNQSSLASAWLFSIVWTVLYILMGVALYLIYSPNPKTKVEQKLQTVELIIYFLQLFFNFMWAILFFRLEMLWFAFGWLIMMWLMTFALIYMCTKNRKAAVWCLVPYLIWCTFAGYLNIVIAALN